MFEFVKKDGTIYRIKDFWKVKKKTDGKFTLVKKAVEILSYRSLSASDAEWSFLKPYWLSQRILRKLVSWSIALSGYR